MRPAPVRRRRAIRTLRRATDTSGGRRGSRSSSRSSGRSSSSGSSSASGTSSPISLLKPRRRFLMPPPHRVIDVAFLDSAQPQRAAAGPVELDEGRDGRPRDRDRARHALRDPHEPGEVDRAVALPLCRGAADDPDPRPRAADRVLVRLQLPQPSDRLRADRDLPDHQQHAVRAVIGRPGPARPVHAPRREPLHAASGVCSCPRACPRSSRASASRPACR